ncbi:MAG: hypothetical protein ACK4KV_18970 [Rhodocyclaceae bacterium]
MMVIFPVEVTDEVLLSSNVAEDDAPEWDAGATYEKGDVVIKASSHRKWESVIDGNTGIDPEEDEADPPRWLALGSTNRYAMFREPIQDTTTCDTEIVVELAVGLIRGVAFFAVDAAQIEMELTSPEEGVVWSRTTNLVFDSNVDDYYEYFFDPPVRQTDFIALDVPPYGAGTLRIRISSPSGPVSIGWMAFGPARYIGATRYGAQFSITDFSIKEYDTFGRQIRRKRNYAKRATAELWVKNGLVEGVFQELARRRSDLLVWATVEEWLPGITLLAGHYKDYGVIANYPRETNLFVEIEGMT